MPICVVQGCHYRRGQKSRKQLKFERETGQMVTLHRFPKDPNRRNLWKEALLGWVSKSSENSFICSVHFTENSWEQSSVNRRLKNDALPTLFPSLTDADQAVARKRRRSQPLSAAVIKQEPELQLEPESPPADDHPAEPLSQEPEVLLTELHRAEPVIPAYVQEHHVVHGLTHAQAMYDAYSVVPPPAHHY